MSKASISITWNRYDNGTATRARFEDIEPHEDTDLEPGDPVYVYSRQTREYYHAIVSHVDYRLGFIYLFITFGNNADVVNSMNFPVGLPQQRRFGVAADLEH